METHKMNGSLKYVVTVAITIVATLLFNAFVNGITLSERMTRLETVVDANANRLDVVKSNQTTVMAQLDMVITEVQDLRKENRKK